MKNLGLAQTGSPPVKIAPAPGSPPAAGPQPAPAGQPQAPQQAAQPTPLPQAQAPAARPQAPAPKTPPQAPPKAPPQAAPLKPPAPASRMRARHWGILLSFLVMVAAPVAVAAWYLWGRAADQYASTVGFSVHAEKTSSALELLGGITELSSSTSSDADILYEFIQSQKLVRDIDNELDLRAIWSVPERDPVFAYHAPGSIEDLVAYWKRMVQVRYDTGTRLIEVRVLAFRPDDATAIAQAIFERSSAVINELSDIARQDAIRYAREERDEAVARLKAARQALTEFRNKHQIVNPASDIEIQVGLLSTLQSQLAEALIEFEILQETTRENDPRITQADRRVRIIQQQIAEERKKLGLGQSGATGDAYATVFGEYESLAVDLEFAEQTYKAALAAYDAALADARRQSRYLAAYILPTSSEAPQFPQRWVLLSVLALFVFLIWAILTLVYYSLKDRR